MLGTAISVVEQSIITSAAILFLVDLSRKGSLTGFLNSLRDNGIIGVFQDPAFSKSLILITIASLAAVVLVAVLGGGFVLSSEYGTYLEAWKSDSVRVRSVLENGMRRWKQMAWTLIVSDVITWGPAVVGYVLIILYRLNPPTTTAELGRFFASSYLAEFLILASLVLSIFTNYSFPAVAHDHVSGLQAVRHSFRTASHNLGITVTYGVVRGLFQLFLTFIVLATSFVGLPLASIAITILSLLLTPVLHSTKTMIYSYASPPEAEMPFQLADPIWGDLATRLPRAAWLKVRTGLSEISHFLLNPRNLPFHIASTLAFVVGVYSGNYVSSSGLVRFLGIQPGRVNPAIERLLPPALGIDIFLHNWLVSIATALAGIGFGLPSFLTILFNGFILGLLIPAFPNISVLWAGILPHGIIEIPSFILAGSVGIKLGYASWKASIQLGPERIEYLSASLRQAVYIVVGLAPLFLVAGLIEGDITPIIIRMVAGS